MFELIAAGGERFVTWSVTYLLLEESEGTREVLLEQLAITSELLGRETTCSLELNDLWCAV